MDDKDVSGAGCRYKGEGIRESSEGSWAEEVGGGGGGKELSRCSLPPSLDVVTIPTCPCANHLLTRAWHWESKSSPLLAPHISLPFAPHNMILSGVEREGERERGRGSDGGEQKGGVKKGKRKESKKKEPKGLFCSTISISSPRLDAAELRERAKSYEFVPCGGKRGRRGRRRGKGHKRRGKKKKRRKNDSKTDWICINCRCQGPEEKKEKTSSSSSSLLLFPLFPLYISSLPHTHTRTMSDIESEGEGDNGPRLGVSRQ